MTSPTQKTLNENVLATVFNKYPTDALRARFVNKNLIDETNDRFYNLECNRKLKKVELEKFIKDPKVNNFIIFVCSINPSDIGFTEIKFMYDGTYNTNILLNDKYVYAEYYNHIYKYIYYAEEDGFMAHSESYAYMIKSDLTSIVNDRSFFRTQYEQQSPTKLYDIVKIISDETNYMDGTHYITMDVRALYKIIEARQQCVGIYASDLAKTAVLRQFNELIVKWENNTYGGKIINWYIAENAGLLGIEYDKELLRYTNEYSENDEILKNEIESTKTERKRVIELIVEAIKRF